MELSAVGLWAIVAGVFGAGSAWGFSRMKHSSTVSRLDRVETEQKAHDAALGERIDGVARDMAAHKQETTDRLARIETKLDVLLSRGQA